MSVFDLTLNICTFINSFIYSFIHMPWLAFCLQGNLCRLLSGTFTDWMHFLAPDQQRQSTEVNHMIIFICKFIALCFFSDRNVSYLSYYSDYGTLPPLPSETLQWVTYPIVGFSVLLLFVILLVSILSVSCSRLNWFHVSFWLHVKYFAFELICYCMLLWE